MEEGSRDGGRGQLAAAPFVVKTYRMVSDPTTDSVISWGSGSNSFVVSDPFAFSQTLLPAHFKHSNFSSFVRQLNTYGFRKVDPDKWEFAHASFLRGQTHLLPNIVRRQSSSSVRANHNKKIEEEEEVDDSVVFELLKLKQEQRSIDEEVHRMWRRLHDIEAKPKQMLAFLVKIVGDPMRLQRLVDDHGGKRVRRRLEAPKRELEEGMDFLSLDAKELIGGFGGIDVDHDFGAVDQFVPTSDMDMYCGDELGVFGDQGMYVGDVF